MRNLWILLLSLMALSCACRAKPSSALPRELASTTVALVSLEGEEMTPYCSGVWVAKDKILTANHCIDGNTFVFFANDQDGDPAIAHVLKVDAAHDLALLSTTSAAVHGVARIGPDPTVGDSCEAEGNPHGLWKSFSVGVVSGIRESDGITWIQSTALIAPGSSGGGLYDASGRLIGITRALVRGSGIGVFVHVIHIRAIMAG